MKRFILFFIFLLFSSLGFAQFELGFDIVEPYIPDPEVEEQPGGLYMPSIAQNGQYVRVLVLFVQFKDDMWNPNWTEWPKNQPPTTWMDESMIDQTIAQNSTNGNITHYFSGMSMGHYKIIGDFQHRVTSQTRDEYIAAGMKRGDIK